MSDLEVLNGSLVGSDTYILKDECCQVKGTIAVVRVKCLSCSKRVPKCSNSSCCCCSECVYTEGQLGACHLYSKYQYIQYETMGLVPLIVDVMKAMHVKTVGNTYGEALPNN